MKGNIWKYSDQLDDWDIYFAQKSFITYKDGCDYYDLSEKKMARIAMESGAVYKIGSKFVRIKREIFESYLRYLYEQGELK